MIIPLVPTRIVAGMGLAMNLIWMMVLAGPSAWAESPTAVAIDPAWAEPLQDLGPEIREDPLALKRLFGLPPDIALEIENSTLTPRIQKGWLGITLKESKPVFLPGGDDLHPVIKVLQVFPDSPADKAGLRPGDLILETNGTALALGKENSLLMNFRHRVADTGAGNPFHLKILRGDAVQDLPLVLESKPVAPLFLKSHPEWAVPMNGESLVERILRDRRLLEPYAQTLEEMRDRTAQVVSTAVKGDDFNPFRLQEVNYVMTEPLDLPLVGRALTDSLQAGFNPEVHDLGALVRAGLEALDIKPVAAPPRPAPESLAALVDRWVRAVETARQVRQKVLAAVTVDDLDILRAGSLDMVVEEPEAELRSKTEAEKAAEEHAKLRFLRTALKLDLEALLTAVWNAGRELNVDALLRLKPEMANEDWHREGWILETRGDRTVIHTPEGDVIVGSPGDDVYTGHALMILDPGGDDRYLGAAGSGDPGNPFTAIIDFEGNDLYSATKDYAQGAGYLGGAFLIDLAGDDRYVARNFAQGAGFLGVGALVDIAGDDTYQCRNFCQGAGFLGVGILADGEGGDDYHAARYAQGLGLVKGYGALVDALGHDRYHAGSVYPDFREPGKAFQSMAQGFAIGLRPWESVVGASGGIGLLLDEEGNDTYVADYFAQGSSYWFSLGVLSDRQGHDTYVAGRYSQGAGVHLSAGMLEDFAGDDDYLARFGVSQGCGHDLAAGFLLDHGGNDRYIGGVLSQGAGNANGIGVLNDNGGDDEYYIRREGQGRGHYETLRELGSFGFLIDTGGGSDRYSQGGRNDHLSLQTQWGILADIP